jgi:hypothetical protein
LRCGAWWCSWDRLAFTAFLSWLCNVEEIYFITSRAFVVLTILWHLKFLWYTLSVILLTERFAHIATNLIRKLLSSNNQDIFRLILAFRICWASVWDWSQFEVWWCLTIAGCCDWWLGGGWHGFTLTA